MTDDQVHPIPFEELEISVLPLVAVASDARWHPLGTSFVVTVLQPKVALVLTAAHNIKFVHAIDNPASGHHTTALPEFLPKKGKPTVLQKTKVHALLKQGSRIVLADMVCSWTLDEIDIALVLLEIPSDVDAVFPATISLDTSPIEMGTPVMAVGYPSMAANFNIPPDYEASRFEIEFKRPIEYRTGKVVEVCPTGSGMHRFPGFHVDFPFGSGMSGGPLIDLSAPEPLVRGLVTSDVSEVQNDGMQGSGLRAFASMLWPAMLIKTHMTVVNTDGLPISSDGTSLVDFIRSGLVYDRGEAHRHIRKREDSAASWFWDSTGLQN